MKKTFFTLLLGSSTLVFAAGSCDAPTNDFDGIYCLNKSYQESDDELNRNFKKLRTLLDLNGKEALKTTQLAWIEHRNHECSERIKGDFYVNLECATKMSLERSQFLQERLRECISAGGCQNSQLR
jgi:uncharacterized protein YecT (DUF1311 family)